MLDNETLRNQLVSRRSFILGVGKFSMLSLLAVKMFYIQLLKSNKYKTLSDKNRISMIVIPPQRGQILDRNGKVIADNKQCFRLMLDKGYDADYRKDIDSVIDLLDLDEEQQNYIFSKINKGNKRIPIMIMDQLKWQQISIIEEMKPDLKSIFIDVGYARNYQYGPSMANLIGYLGAINEIERSELEITTPLEYNIGKVGIEKYYDKLLRGEFGYRQIEINAYGKPVRELSKANSKVGDNLPLNINADVQDKIIPYLTKTGCSAIAMDITNGEIIVLATSPSYDPNNFAKLTNKYWNSLIQDPLKPLLNKPVQSASPPGSIFKLITVLAALEFGMDPERKIMCTGASALGTNSFRCAARNGHGLLDMSQAIKYSCNTYMYEIGKKIGPENILNMASRFGLGEKTGIDLPSEVGGFLPSLKWKKAKYKREWTLGDTLNLTIGQGFLLTTPIQLVRLTAAIANDGYLLTPMVAKDEAKSTKINICLEHLKIVQRAMHDAINTPGGTGYYSRIIDPLREIAGKTGTAQVQAKANVNDDLNRDSIAWERRNHAVYTAFGPFHSPKYAVVVFVDHGGGGGRVAAPIGSKILSELL